MIIESNKYEKTNQLISKHTIIIDDLIKQKDLKIKQENAIHWLR